MRFWARRRVAATLLTILTAALAVGGLARAQLDTTASSLLPRSDPVLAATQDAARWFGGDPIVILAETDRPKALLTERLPQLLHLEADLAKLPDAAVVYGPGTLLNQVAGTARNLVATISGRRDAIKAEAEAAARARGARQPEVDVAVGAATADFDARYASLLVRGLPAGLPTLRNPGFVDAIVFGDGNTPRAEWRYVIPSANAVAILVRPREGLDQAGTTRLVAAARTAAERADLGTNRLTVTGSPAVAAALGAAVQREIPLIGGIAVLLIAACYQFMPWTRRRAHRLLPLAATLASTALTVSIFGWLGRPLSLGVITFLPILLGIGSDFPAYLLHARTPRRRVVVVALASALGFAALALSPLPFVRDLGAALSVGLLIAVAMALALRALIGRNLDREHPAPAEPPSERLEPPRRQRLIAVTLAVAAAAIGWSVLPGLGIEARPDRLAAGLPAIADARHAEEVLGSSGEVQIRLQGANVRTPEGLQWMRQAQDAVVTGHGDALRPILSLPDLLRFLGPAPSAEQLGSALGLLPHYLTAAVLTDGGTQAVISLGMSLQDLGQQRALIDAVRATLPPTPAGTTADIVGLPVVAVRGFALVSEGRYLSNLAGIAAAGLVLLLGLRRSTVAARAVLAALLATGWSLAAAWLLGISLSPLSVALGSLTTATACEFTVLLGYARTRAGLRRTVVAAALAACLGYLALGLSQLSLIRDFGLLLAGTVALSLLAAHLVVWAWPRQPTSAPAVLQLRREEALP